jgi:hypothetical protein
MYDLEKEKRRNRRLLASNIVLFIGALSLFVAGSRGLVGWAVLLSCGANLLGVLLGRRALARLGAALAGPDRDG